jgi:uncharacterized protein YsxB (DUF464 family)
MIQADIRIDGNEFSFELQGHAEFNPGNDIVCAGVSAIAYALLGYLENNQDRITDFYENDICSGFICIRLSGADALTPAFEMAAIGIMQIANQYPENVKANFFAGGQHCS